MATHAAYHRPVGTDPRTLVTVLGSSEIKGGNMKWTQVGTASVHHPRATDPGPPAEQRTDKVDAVVGAVTDATREFCRLDKKEVDWIVGATVRAGPEAAAEPGVLAAVPLVSGTSTRLRLGQLGGA